MRYKILFISSWYPNKLEPTNGNFVQRHAEAVAIEHDVEVLHAIGDDQQKKKFLIDDGLINGIRTLIVYYRNTRNPLMNFLNRMQAYRIGYRNLSTPDLVHANVLHNNMLFAVFLKMFYKIPFVVTEHWTALQEENQSNTSSSIKKIAKFIGNKANYILPVSNNLLKSLQNLGISTPMQVISNVVNTDIFKISDKEKPPRFTFIHVSSLIPRKKPENIMLVTKKLHDEGYPIALEIGGDGNTEPLNTLVANWKAEDYITVFGALSYAEVAEKISTSDCFILFSENETQGCVILESFACGIPVIATKVGGVPEFVQDNFGLLIEKNNEEELYNAMKSVMERKENFETPEKLRKYILENYSKEAIAKQFNEIYKKILS